MSDKQDVDAFTKAASKLIDDWGDAIEKIVAAVKKAGEEAEKQKAAQKKAEDDAAKANEELRKKLFDLKIPPAADPGKVGKLPDWLTKTITKNGVKMGDYGSIKPDIDVDLKKKQLKKVGLTWTFDW